MSDSVIVPSATLIGVLLGFIGCAIYMIGTKIESDNTAGLGFAFLCGGIATVLISMSKLSAA